MRAIARIRRYPQRRSVEIFFPPVKARNMRREKLHFISGAPSQAGRLPQISSTRGLR